MVKIEVSEKKMDETKLQRVVLVIVRSEDFSKVRTLLEAEKIEFFVNDPMLGVSAITGVKLLKE